MKKTRLILVILLAVLLLSYFVLRIAKPAERSKKVFRLNLDKVEKIEIFNSEDRLELILDEGIWKVNSDVLWQADSLKIHELFENVLKAEYPTTAMSDAEGAVQRYQLKDEQALHIRVSEKSRWCMCSSAIWAMSGTTSAMRMILRFIRSKARWCSTFSPS